MFGNSPTTFPITTQLRDSTVYTNAAQPLPAADLLMMASPADSCPRLGLVKAAIAANQSTIDLKAKITAYLNTSYFPRLKTLLGDSTLTDAQLYNAAEVIEWAQ